MIHLSQHAQLGRNISMPSKTVGALTLSSTDTIASLKTLRVRGLDLECNAQSICFVTCRCESHCAGPVPLGAVLRAQLHHTRSDLQLCARPSCLAPLAPSLRSSSMQLSNPSPPCHITVSSSRFTQTLKTSHFWVIEEQLDARINPLYPCHSTSFFI